MSDTFDWLELKPENEILSWFIAACASSNQDIFDDDFDSSRLDINMCINGHDVLLLDVFNDLSKQIDKNIKKAKSKGFKKGRAFQLKKMEEFIKLNEVEK